MKPDFRALPENIQAEITSTRALLSACRSQLHGANAELVFAYAKHARRLQADLDALEGIAEKFLRADFSGTASAATASEGGDHR